MNRIDDVSSEIYIPFTYIDEKEKLFLEIKSRIIGLRPIPHFSLNTACDQTPAKTPLILYRR